MRLERFTLRGQEAIQSAIEAAERNQHQQVEPEHLLLAMLEQPEGVVRPLLGKLGANLQVVLNDLQAAVARLPKVQGGSAVLQPAHHAGLPGRAEGGRADAGRVRLDRAPAPRHHGREGRRGGAHPAPARRQPRRPLQGHRADARRRPRHRPERGGQLSGALEVRERPDGARAPGQARPGHRPRRRDTPHRPGLYAPDEEQPRAHRRAGRRQDGDCRRLGAAHRLGRRARNAAQQAARRARPRLDARRREVPRRV